MPLVSHIDTGGSALLFWRISETPEELCALVTGEDRESAVSFTSPTRRLERLAWRAALRTLIPDEQVIYSETGAPFLHGRPAHISAAHTAGFAVAMVSRSVCAVDVERIDREYARVATKFISPRESQLPDAVRPEFPAAVWCAKEAMYKYSGRRELDFLRDLNVLSCDLSAGKIGCEIAGQAVQVNVVRYEEYLIAYII